MGDRRDRTDAGAFHPVATDVEVNLGREGASVRAARDSPVTQAPGITLLPVHPVTLEDDEDRLPLRLGENATAVASPDGQLIAVAQDTGAAEWPTVLEVVRTDDWRVQLRVDAFAGYPWLIQFLPGSAALVWAGASDGTTQDIVHVPLDDPSARTTHRLPDDHWPVALQPLSATRVAVVTENPAQMNAAPEMAVLTLDLDSGEISEPLVVMRPLSEPVRTLPDGQSVFPFVRPGLAWDVDAQRLFVVTEATLSAVDLAGEPTVDWFVVPPPATAPSQPAGAPAAGDPSPVPDRAAAVNAERLLASAAEWFVPSAHAGGGWSEGIWWDAAVGDDRLYVTGHRIGVADGEDGRTVATATPLGIRVFDTATLAEVDALDAPVDTVRLSPDGRTLLATTQSTDVDGQPGDLLVLDAATLAERARHPDVGVEVAGFHADGELAYVRRWHGGISVSALDLGSGEIVGRTTGSVYLLVPEVPAIAAYRG